MSKVMQSLVILMEPSEHAHDDSLKAGNMILNRFCIDEDAAFELSGCNNLKKSSDDMVVWESIKFKTKKRVKGKEFIYSCDPILYKLRNLIFMNN